ncbi:hypothetical protein [Salinisphaera orenii]
MPSYQGPGRHTSKSVIGEWRFQRLGDVRRLDIAGGLYLAALAVVSVIAL